MSSLKRRKTIYLKLLDKMIDNIQLQKQIEFNRYQKRNNTEKKLRMMNVNRTTRKNYQNGFEE
jgi:hypothetical protein